jgi:hypothetical protein
LDSNADAHARLIMRGRTRIGRSGRHRPLIATGSAPSTGDHQETANRADRRVGVRLSRAFRVVGQLADPVTAPRAGPPGRIFMQRHSYRERTHLPRSGTSHRRSTTSPDSSGPGSVRRRYGPCNTGFGPVDLLPGRQQAQVRVFPGEILAGATGWRCSSRAGAASVSARGSTCRHHAGGALSWSAHQTVDEPWRKMPRKVQPYGSGDDTEAAALESLQVVSGPFPGVR